MGKEKFTVETIEERAITTLKNVEGCWGKNKVDKPIIFVRQWRWYCNQVLFLCKEIKKLKKKLGE